LERDRHEAVAAVPWQERQRRLREEALLDAAATLMAERGYAAASMDELAARVGISKPTLYQHFASKEALAVAVALRRMAQAELRMAEAETRADEACSARAQLEEVLAAELARSAGLWATRVDLPRAVLDASPAVGAARERVWARLGALVDRCKAEGGCRADVPTPVIVRHLASLFRDDYADLLADGTTACDTFARLLVSMVFDGLAPRAAAAAAAPRPAARGGARVRRASALAAACLGLHATAARAQGQPPTPLYDATVPSQTVAVPGVPASAGGRAPGTPATPAAVAGRALTLADVLDAALRANPTARGAFADAEAARAQVAVARGAFFPVLSLNPGFTRSQTITSAGAGGAAGTARLFNERTQFSPSVGLTFLLFDFGGRSGRVGVARESANSAESAFDATVVNTVLAAEQAYFNYQSARQVVEAQDANVRTAALSRDAAVARYRAGLATVADTLQAATALAQAQVSGLNARTEQVAARAALATVMNARADARFVVAADSAPTAAAAARATAALTANVDTLVARAQRVRPDVDAARAAALAATEQVRVARAATLPAVTVTGAGGYNQVRNLPQLTGYTYNVQVGLAFPFFDGGARRAGVQSANAAADAARLRADAATADAVNQTVASAAQLRLAADRLATSDALLASAARNEEVARGRYREGVGSVVDLLTAQSLLFGARAQNAQARWAWATALAQLARDAGLLGGRGELPAVAAPAQPPPPPHHPPPPGATCPSDASPARPPPRSPPRVPSWAPPAVAATRPRRRARPPPWWWPRPSPGACRSRWPPTARSSPCRPCRSSRRRAGRSRPCASTRATRCARGRCSSRSTRAPRRPRSRRRRRCWPATAPRPRPRAPTPTASRAWSRRATSPSRRPSSSGPRRTRSPPPSPPTKPRCARRGSSWPTPPSARPSAARPAT
jgi:outer membrane protein TolC/AcrR family transcriptional regulator